jgi:hypothetical protein
MLLRPQVGRPGRRSLLVTSTKTFALSLAAPLPVAVTRSACYAERDPVLDPDWTSESIAVFSSFVLLS